MTARATHDNAASKMAEDDDDRGLLHGMHGRRVNIRALPIDVRGAARRRSGEHRIPSGRLEHDSIKSRSHPDSNGARVTKN